jgi:hypothetical protein
MHNKIKSKKKSWLDKQFIRITVNIFFISIFSLSSLVQHLDSFSFINNSSSCKESYSKLSSANQLHTTKISGLSSQESLPSASDMEFSEDEENENNDDESSSNHCHRFHEHGLAFNGILQSRYLQLLSSRHRQTKVDFFILYHSWKKHIA